MWSEQAKAADAAPPLQRRLQWSLISLGYAVAGVLVGLPLFGAALVSLATVPIGVGIVGCVALAPVIASWAGAHRRSAAELVQRRADVTYRRALGDGIWSRARVWSRDPQRWRDFAHTIVAATVGLVLSALPAALLAAAVTHVVLTVVLDVPAAWLFGPLVVADLLAWWFLTPAVVRWRARLDLAVLVESETRSLERRVDEVTQTRAETLDTSAAELRRIERDLHDGAQARLVSLGMNLGMVESLMRDDPEAAAALVREAHEGTRAALDELRAVVRNIHPPVLADRGLVGAIEAAALDAAVAVEVRVEDGIALAPPVEAAAYFAVVELLTNTVKHARARQARIEVRHDGETLRIVVWDDGRGGADLRNGSGLQGIVRRLAAFDGTVTIDSPAGGPTTIRLEVPCEPSSPTTMPS